MGPLWTLNSVVRGLYILGAQQVGGQQVRRELHAREPGVDALGDRLDQQRLGQPGHALQQDVPVGHEGHEHPVHEGVLADYDLADLGNQPTEKGCALLDLFVHLPDGCQFHVVSPCARQAFKRPQQAADARLIVQFYDTHWV